MGRYQLVRDGAVIDTREFAGSPPALAPNKGAWTLEPPRELSAEDIAAMRAAKVGAVKLEARRRILEQYPEWKQANMTARGVELANLRQDRAWTEEEAAEAAELQGTWDAIKAIRARSDEIEALIPQDAAGVAAFDPTQGWG